MHTLERPHVFVRNSRPTSSCTAMRPQAHRRATVGRTRYPIWATDVSRTGCRSGMEPQNPEMHVKATQPRTPAYLLHVVLKEPLCVLFLYAPDAMTETTTEWHSLNPSSWPPTMRPRPPLRSSATIRDPWSFEIENEIGFEVKRDAISKQTLNKLNARQCSTCPTGCPRHSLPYLLHANNP